MMGIVLHADCIGKRFGERPVLTSSSLWLSSGRVVALVGRNGAGKSTLLRICAGLLRADSGQVRLRGEWVSHPRHHTMAQRGVAYLPSERNLYASTFPIGPQLAVAARRRGSKRLDEVVQTLELGGCLSQAPHTLSGGEQRRASVAITWLLEPDCLLADEPLRGIDPKDQERIMRAYHAMADNGCAIAVTGHQAEYLLQEVHEVVWMTAGTTHHLGRPAAAREHWQFRREFLGIRGSVA